MWKEGWFIAYFMFDELTITVKRIAQTKKFPTLNFHNFCYKFKPKRKMHKQIFEVVHIRASMFFVVFEGMEKN